MANAKCPICEKKCKAAQAVCPRCGASLDPYATERLALTSGGYTWYDISIGLPARFSSCKASITDRRLVIYKIKPGAKNPIFGLFYDLYNTIKKRPYISIYLKDIQWVKRYDEKHEILTNAGVCNLWLKKNKEFDALFAPYKHI